MLPRRSRKSGSKANGDSSGKTLRKLRRNARRHRSRLLNAMLPHRNHRSGILRRLSSGMEHRSSFLNPARLENRPGGLLLLWRARYVIAGVIVGSGNRYRQRFLGMIVLQKRAQRFY